MSVKRPDPLKGLGYPFSMFTATFTFAAGAFDDQFHAMDQAIAEAARVTPGYLAAKARQQEWLNGYQVVIAQVLANYGDGSIAHPLAGRQLPAGRLGPAHP